LNREFREKEILKKVPDVLIVATGSKPIVPDVPGIRNDFVMTANDVLSGAVEVKGREVVIIGASQTGCETAEFLLEQGCEVNIVDRLPAHEIAPDAIPDHRSPLLARLGRRGAKIFTEQTLKEIRPECVIVVSAEGREWSLEADTVVLAMGTAPIDEIAERMKGKVAEIYTIGDSAGTHKIADAIYSGSIIGSRI